MIPLPLTLTEEEYDALPREIQRRIEVVDGVVVLKASGNQLHDQAVQQLACRLRSARPPSSCMEVAAGREMHSVRRRLDESTLSFRRPDITVHRRLSKRSRLTASDAAMVVEVVSAGSEFLDTVGKRAEYAFENIPVYLIVHLDSDAIRTVQEYRPERVGGDYQLAETHVRDLHLAQPYPVI